MIIDIIVSGKVARPKDNSSIVCGNSDYVINFSFDEEWNEHEVKTARFAYSGKYTDVVFTGNQCNAPILTDTPLVGIGVYAGDLRTTTPAMVGCERSIVCESGVPDAPSEDVYNQIIELINSGILKGEQGEKGEKGDKGDKGDAGVIKFIPVVALPTENIDQSAIYLVPIENADGENRFTEYAYIDGKWETLGAISIQVDHSEYVKFTDYATANKAGVSKTNGKGLIISEDGELQLYQASRFDIDKKASLYNPITPFRLDYAVKVGITTNTETLTDEEKTSACDWLGALKAFDGSQETGDLRYTVYGQQLGAQAQIPYTSIPKEGALARYASGNSLKTGLVRADNDCTNKAYVDGLIAELVARIEALESK